MRNDDERAPKKEAQEAMMRLLAETVTSRFNVIFSPDFGGKCMIAMAEREPGEDCEGRNPFQGWKGRPAPFMGWRVVYLHVPDGYIDVFYDTDGEYRITGEA